MNYYEYVRLVRKHPKLTSHGFGVETKYEKLTIDELFEVKRSELFLAFEPFSYCCEWIAQNPGFDGKLSAYHWKHQVEYWLQERQIQGVYVAQGVFILAAKHLGYSVRKIARSPNARFGKRGGYRT